MNFKRTFLITILLLPVVLFGHTALAQDKGDKVVTFSALIQAVSKDSNFIVINEAKVFLSGAKIVNDTGTVLGIGDLKPKLYVTVEAVERPSGALARKITVVSSSKVPKNLRKAL